MTLSQVFDQTTISVDNVTNFLLDVPRYREAGRALGVSSHAGRLLHWTDSFEFELRQYLAAETRTRYHLNRSTRTFLLLYEHSARTMIRFSLNAVETTLLANEWYEIMPRYRDVRRHMQKTFAI